MPTYTYACVNPVCWKRESPVEVQHRMSDCDKLTVVCPECNGKMERRIVAVPLMYWPGRAIGERDGWFWDPFPKMQSVRDGEHKFAGVDLPKP